MALTDQIPAETETDELSVQAEAVVRPPPGHPRFPLLDPLRGVAAVAILITHAFLLGGLHGRPGGLLADLITGGPWALAMFFAISGFLLYRPFVAADMGLARQVPLADYFRRRLLRIVPAYWVALTILAIYPGLPGVFTSDWWRYYFLLSGYTPHAASEGILVSWSLGIEITFYLMLPFYAKFVSRLARGRSVAGRLRLELLLLLLIGVASTALRGVDYARGDHLWVQQSLPVFMLWLGIGMALAVASAVLQSPDAPLRLRTVTDAIGRHPALMWALGALTYVPLCAWIGDGVHYSTLQWVVGYYLANGLIACAVILPSIFGDRSGWPRRILSWRWLIWLGMVSYGMYIYHLPMLVWLHDRGVRWFPAVAVLGLGLAVTAAGISYHYLERPILRFKYRGRPARRVGPPG